MVKTIAVIGATGSQGGSVARTFTKRPDWKVRGITRNPDSDAAQKLKVLGVEVAKADLDDTDSLETAFMGVNAIFGVTDFWQFAQDPETHALAKAKGITWNEACYLRELQQGKNIIDAAARLAEHGELERLVLSSLCDVKKASGGKYTWVYHFDSKAHFVQYLKEAAETKPSYRLLYERTSYVQIGNYLDNWKKNPIFSPQKQSDGSYLFRAIKSGSPIDVIRPIPFVHPPKDTGPFVEALVLKAPPGTTLLGTSSLLSYPEYVNLWAETLGVKAALDPISLEQVSEMFPGGFGTEVGQTICFITEFGWDGGEGAVLPEQVGVNPLDLTDIVSYIKTTHWSSVLGRVIKVADLSVDMMSTRFEKVRKRSLMLSQTQCYPSHELPAFHLRGTSRNAELTGVGIVDGKLAEHQQLANREIESPEQ